MWRLAVPRSVMGVPVSNPYGGLGALSPQDATNQIFPTSKIGSSAGHNQSIWNVMEASAAAGQMLDQTGAPAYVPGGPDCAGVSLATPTILATAGGLAIKFAGLAGPAAPLVALAGGVLDIFGAIFGHHAAAVAKERSILCAAVPAANQTLQLIDQAVQNGQATPQQAMAAVQALPAQFQAQVAGIIQGTDPTSSGECNAACVMLSELKAICLVRASTYQDLATAAASNPASGLVPIGVTSAISSAAASTGLPSWVFWLGGAYLLWELL